MNTKELTKKYTDILIKTDVSYQLLVIDTATEIYNANIGIIRHFRKRKNLTDKSKEILNVLINENKKLRPLLAEVN